MGEFLQALGDWLDPTVVRTLDLAESSVSTAVRPWVETPHFSTVRGDLLERIKQVLEANGPA